MEKSKRLGWGAKLAFGIGAFGKDAAYAIVGTYLMLYLTDFRSVSPAFVGILFMAARIWDAFNDPLMGVVVDNTRSRFGKFRPWILIGTVLNAVILALLFANHDLAGRGYLVWCTVFYLLWGMTYTVMDIPFWSMVPALTDDADERSQVSAIPRIFASAAWLVVNSFGLSIVALFGGGDDLAGFARFAIAISCVFILSSVVTCLFTRERIVTPAREKTGVRGMLRVLFRNDQVKVVLGIALFFNLAYQLSNSFALYYFKYVAEHAPAGAGNGVLYPVYAGVAGFAQIGSMALFPIAFKRIGKHVSFFLAAFLPPVGFALLCLFGYLIPESVIGVGVCSAIINAGVGFMLVFITVLLSEVVDYGEWKLGTRNESVLFSMQTFIVKFAGALSGFISGIGLSLIGFVANREQTAGTIAGMRVIMFLIPAVLSVLSWICYRFGYRLSPEKNEEIRDAVRARRGETEPEGGRGEP